VNIKDLKKYKIPDGPGVYFFLGRERGDILYIGKATSLRDRVKSYFGKDLISTRGLMILDMVVQAEKIKWQKTDSVLEALILEAKLIKKYQPKYNTKEKDNKSWNYVCITDEEIPKVIIKRGKDLRNRTRQKFSQVLGSLGPYPSQTIQKHLSDSVSFVSTFGPYTNSTQLKEAMKIIRRIFPYEDEQSIKRNNKEFYKQLGLIPAITVSQKNAFQKVLGSPRDYARPDHFEKYFSATQLEYKKNIKNLKLFFEGKKKKIIRDFKKEMIACAKKKEFEKAGEIKNKIFALEHINDVALIKEDVSQKNAFQKVLGSPRDYARPDHFEKHFSASLSRLEAYDIAHMAGRDMVGVMTVVEDGKLAKNEHKKFIIKTQTKANDTGALEEVLSRRFRHTEWGLPSLIVMDGSVAQINIAKKVLNRYQFKIPVVGVVKDDKHKAKAIQGDEKIIKKYKKEILLANNEAHRFAITFHKKRRNKNFLV